MNFEQIFKDLNLKVKLNIEYTKDVEEKSEFIGISQNKLKNGLGNNNISNFLRHKKFFKWGNIDR